MFSWSIATLSFCFQAFIDPTVSLDANLSFESIAGSFLYLIIAFLLLLFGVWAGYSNSLKYIRINKFYLQAKSTRKYFLFKRSILITLSLFVFASGLLIFIKSGSSFDLASQRQSLVDNMQSNEGEVRSSGSGTLAGYLGIISQAVGMMFAPIIPWVKGISMLSKLFYSSLFLGGFVLISFTTGGRFNILVCYLFPLILSFILLNRDSISANLGEFSISGFIKVSLFVVTSLIVLTLFLTWNYFRYENSGETLSAYMLENQLNHHNQFLISLGFNGPLNFYVAFGMKKFLDYVPNGILNFPYFFSNYDYGPALGGYQFHLVTSKLPGFSGYQFQELRYQIFSHYRTYGIDSYVWGTYLRDYIVDFGRLLSPIFSFVTGFLIGFLENISMQKKSLFVFYVISICWLFSTPFFSIFFFGPVQVAFILTSIWIYVDFALMKKNKIKYS
jgi:hypothetical protein